MLGRIIITANVFCVLAALCLTAVNAQPRLEASEEAWRDGKEIPYSTFINIVEQDKVRQANFEGNRIRARFNNNKTVITYVPMGEKPVARLLEHKVTVFAQSTEDPPTIVAIIANWLPYLLSLWFFVARPLLRIVRRLEQIHFPEKPPVGAVDTIKGDRG